MDIRRTILLMIFSFSLLMLWNNWQVHQGNPPLFGAPTAVKPSTPVSDPATAAGGVPVAPVAITPAATASTVPGLAAQVTAPLQSVTFKTDVLSLTFDLQGAQLIRTDLLAFPSVEDPTKPFTLLERVAGHT